MEAVRAEEDLISFILRHEVSTLVVPLLEILDHLFVCLDEVFGRRIEVTALETDHVWLVAA
jgi:hypothetical protein